MDMNAKRTALFTMAVCLGVCGFSKGATLLHYTFEGTPPTVPIIIPDQAGSDNGTVIGNPFFVEPDPGSGLTSLDFTNDRISFASVAELSTLGGNVTVEAIVYPRANLPTQQFIVSNWPGGGFQFTLGSLNGVFFGTYSDGLSGHNDDATSVDVLPTNSWYHLAVVRDAVAGQVRFYVNGVLKETDTLAWGLSSMNNAFSIGARFDESLFFDGLIAEVRVSDVALSPGQFLSFSSPAPAITPLGFLTLVVLVVVSGSFVLLRQTSSDREGHSAS